MQQKRGGGAADLDTVIGTDDRTLVSDTTMIPYRSVCFVNSTKSGGQSGIGAVIGRYRVLTCAHLFWDKNTQTFYTGTVKPGYDEGRSNSTPYGTISIKRVILSQDYIKNGKDGLPLYQQCSG